MQKPTLNFTVAKQLSKPFDMTPGVEQMPEKVLQFGTGVLLRGLPDYLIDLANRQGKFNGRVVQVKSTAKGSVSHLKAQDNLYTLVEQGLERGEAVQHFRVISSLSRTLEASIHWGELQDLIASKTLEIIISNTTEVGLKYVPESVLNTVPASFPGKLAALLYHRYQVFQGMKGSGLTIIPCELIPDNGQVLKQAIVQHAQANAFESAFFKWLDEENVFCNSLVDRIVPGSPSSENWRHLEPQLPYHDSELIVSELYALWAIEFPAHNPLPMPDWHQVHPNWILTRDITTYRERKLRLLNGTHTAMVGLALMCGFDTVGQAMNDPVFFSFVKNLMLNEIVPTLPMPSAEANAFAFDVLDRFQNPFIEHKLINITLEYTSKMHMRNEATVLRYINQKQQIPQRLALGFAALMAFMKPDFEREGKYFRLLHGRELELQDSHAAIWHEAWQQHGHDAAGLARAVLSDSRVWGAELIAAEAFQQRVGYWLDLLLKKPAAEVLQLVEQARD